MHKMEHAAKAEKIKEKMKAMIAEDYDKNMEFESEEQAIIHAMYHMMLCKERATHHEKEHYCHKTRTTDADMEMHRIIETGNEPQMRELSNALSEHYVLLQSAAPQMYAALVEKMKKI